MGKICVVLVWDLVGCWGEGTYACPTNEPTHSACDDDGEGMRGRCAACVGEDLLDAFVGDEVDAGSD